MKTFYAAADKNRFNCQNVEREWDAISIGHLVGAELLALNEFV